MVVLVDLSCDYARGAIRRTTGSGRLSSDARRRADRPAVAVKSITQHTPRGKTCSWDRRRPGTKRRFDGNEPRRSWPRHSGRAIACRLPRGAIDRAYGTAQSALANQPISGETTGKARPSRSIPANTDRQYGMSPMVKQCRAEHSRANDPAMFPGCRWRAAIDNRRLAGHDARPRPALVRLINRLLPNAPITAGAVYPS